MDNKIQIFNSNEFGEIRTISVDGKEYFFGVDIATALTYKRPVKAITDNCKGVLYQDTIKNSGGYREPLIPEGDVYRLIVKASSQATNKEIAEKADRFERVIFDEILPSIRKNGKYEVDRSKLPQGYQVMYEMMDNISEIRLSQINQQKRIDAVEKSVGTMRNDFDIFKDEMPLFPVDTDRITDAAKKKGVEVMGGKDSMAYYDRGLRQTVYRDIYGEIHRQFGVRSYREIPRKDTDRAIAVIERYTPPIVLAERIEKKNAA